jgi:hypothetical protein
MKRPFNIFPSVGYKNSQFQIVSSFDNLKIDIYDQDKIVKSIEANSKNPTLLTSLNSTGKLIAKCKIDNEIFQQDIEIKEAFRLGSSEFKKAFVFNDADYSFFPMKDRLLLFDEKKKILLTENHYSPTEIYKINKTNYLFVTKVGSSASGIVNLGIYNTETFSIVGELLNDYREIRILPETNKAWLYNIKSNTIHCFEIAQNTNRYFTELKKYDGFSDFFINDSFQSIFINYDEKLNISNINNLHNAIEIPKLPNNAIDKLGNVFSIERNSLTHTKCFTNYFEKIQPTFELNLQSENFIYIGNELKSKIELTDLNKKVEETKDDIITLIPENKTYYYHTLSESERISDSYTTHNIYPTIEGIFIVHKEVKRNFNGVTFKKHQDKWNASAYVTERNEYTLLFFSSTKVEVLIDKAPSLTISEYQNPMLLVNSQHTKFLFSGNNKFTLESETSIELFTVNEISYFLIKSKEKSSLYRSANFKNPILSEIEILNPDLIEEHQIIWYSGKEKYVSSKNYLNAFDLKTCSRIIIDERKVQHSLFKDAFDFKFFEKYALSSNQIVFNPVSLEIKDAFVGAVESYSKDLDKIVSHRANIVYLSIFNTQTRKYELSEIPIDDHKYKESYLSPNGQFLVLQDESNKYAWYDIEKNETIRFISGNFLAFSNDGNLIVEQDGTKAVKIIDPKTFQDITPPNYHHYRFMSPDGKLYAQVSSKVRYYHKLNSRELKVEEVSKFRQDLDEPSFYLQEKEKESAKIKVDKNRLQIFNSLKEQFQNLGIDDYTKITSHSVVKVEKYIEIGISRTSIVKEVVLPEDTQFYNYASFSYDNKFLGMVYRLGTGGGINFIKLKYDEQEKLLDIVDTYLSRYPRYASWVCGFAKTGFFATYDSTPDTYIINVVENLFENKSTEIELRQNIYKTKTNIYHTYNKWNEIKGKNFLCFSPTGDFLALSEQGYEPLTLGGYGHQESGAVHIANTNTGKLVCSFNAHGSHLVNPKIKDTIFVSFSEDEKRLMSMSKDGVVIVRDLDLKEPIINEKIEEMPAANIV